MKVEVQVRRLLTPGECAAMEAVQREVWDRRLVIGAPHVFASIKTGGIALGAFAGGEPVGFCYGFPACRGGLVWLHSHMLAVLPAWRGRDIGYRLKLAQREEALADGFTRISWTFDPLQAANAHLNLNKLGAEGVEYLEDYYGQMEDPLNRGLPTDRLLVNWHLTAGRPAGAAIPSLATAPAVNPAGLDPAGRPVSGPPDLSRTEDRLRVHFPAGFAAIRAADPELALDWRLKTRAALAWYLGAGYRAVAVSPPAGELAAYLLVRV